MRLRSPLLYMLQRFQTAPVHLRPWEGLMDMALCSLLVVGRYSAQGLTCSQSFLVPRLRHTEAPPSSEPVCLSGTACLHHPGLISLPCSNAACAGLQHPICPLPMLPPLQLFLLQLDCRSSLASRLLLLELACPCAAAGRTSPGAGLCQILKSTASFNYMTLSAGGAALCLSLHPSGPWLGLACQCHLLVVSPGAP